MVTPSQSVQLPLIPSPNLPLGRSDSALWVKVKATTAAQVNGGGGKWS